MSKQVIWYNPEEKCYETGSKLDFFTKSGISKREEEYTLLYEFSATSERLAGKIINELNKVKSANYVS
ncbi:MAG: hypothetical protein KI790_11075 [Cyclobacteriaceae bacterium]|nr:hypothetical protein [Cyclobacteriaceae bacterium HetDA_MAG_MS6]